ncbi:MAG: hypothetical protein WC666_01870 [Candidatus Paceibacterota bacterium]|jgi:hypothetical protein
MTTSYKQFFNTMLEEKPSPALFEQIMNKIADMETRRLRIRTTTHGITVITAFALLIPTTSNFFSNIAQSEFMQYVSLLISDWSTLINSWKDILLSIAGSWPFVWSILLLGAFIVFINSLRRLVINASTLSTYKHTHLIRI